MTPPLPPVFYDSTKRTERPTVIVDGFNIFLRHFCVNGATNYSGDPVGGVVGFFKSIASLTNNLVPAQVIVVWEQGGASPRRKALFEGYKANRAKDKTTFKMVAKDASETHKPWLMDDNENRIKQLHLLTQVLKQVPVCQIYLPETECDDIIAYLCKAKLLTRAGKKIVVSSDKDFYQLLEDPNVQIYDPAKHVLVDASTVFDKYGISARNFCLAKALSGDPSDNIDGIDGIGFKTAVKRFPVLALKDRDVLPDEIISLAEEKISEKTKVKVYSEVLKNKETLYRNWKLMYFTMSNLASQQQDKVNYTVDSFKPEMNKIGLIKTFMDAKVSTDIDFDRISVQFKTTLI